LDFNNDLILVRPHTNRKLNVLSCFSLYLCLEESKRRESGELVTDSFKHTEVNK
jgi:hypothetical protein